MSWPLVVEVVVFIVVVVIVRYSLGPLLASKQASSEHSQEEHVPRVCVCESVVEGCAAGPGC